MQANSVLSSASTQTSEKWPFPVLSDILRPVTVYEALVYYSDRDPRVWTHGQALQVS